MPSVVTQGVTGIALAYIGGYPLSTPWLLLSIGLYGLIGSVWLPAVWLQIRMRDLAIDAANGATPLPETYQRYYRWRFALGWPAFIGVLVIFYLMVTKPVF